MTNEAKVSQLLMGGGKFDNLKRDHPDGYGVLCAHAYDGGAAKLEAQNAMQAWFLENSTYGIPVSFWAETLHSAQSGATIFPAPVNLGASWNSKLVHDVAAMIGYEARLQGVDRALSPELQVDTDPRFGRTDEAFGEDPHLVAQLGVAYAVGIQGGAVGGPDTYANFSAMMTEVIRHIC
jgi:beta-glucosidase-like glycosyl hydrolase